MSEHLTKEQLEHYADRSLKPAELLEADDHLSGCSVCREKAIGASKAFLAGIGDVLTPTVDADLDHPGHELIEGYVDGTLGDVDKEIVEGHLEFCRNCAAEVAELRSFREMLASGPDKTYAPAVGAGMFQRIDSPASSTVKSVPMRYRFAPAFALAAAVLIAAVVVLNHGKHASPTSTSTGAQVAKVTPAPGNETQSPFTPPAPSISTPPSTPPSTQPSTPSPIASTAPPVSTEKAQAPKATVGSPSTEPRTTARDETTPAPTLKTGAVTRHEVSAPKSAHAGAKPIPTPEPSGTLLHPDDMIAMSAPAPSKSAPATANAPTSAAVNGAPAPAPAIHPSEKVAANTPKLPDSVKEALASGHIDLDTPEIRELTGAGMMSMESVGAAPASFTVTSPVSTAVLSDRPAFSWEAAKDASAYQVTVVDANGGDVEDSPVLTATAWKAAKPLPRGQLLKWRVKAMSNGAVVDTAPDGGARFRVVDADRAAQIEDAQKTFADQPTALGILYAQAGMLDAAERELTKARKEDPDNEVVAKLLSDVRSVRQIP